ncbi:MULTISPECIES: type VI secretion system baseplate subunit TssF [Photorhabdus]|nr:type VI secretion system baseplate subunit TssF [Photorhabdus asymbiotica]RKS57057.1 type VI secretion system protein ImpG [Photorhabdus asymbiotica]
MNRRKSLFLQELSYMRQLAQEAAKENPHLADFLSEGAGDPGVERLMQGFALIASRIRYKIEDNFPEYSLGMMTRIWPQALRPLPPTSLVQFSPTGENHLGSTTLPAGTPIFAGEGEQKMCFETCCPLHIEPLTVINRQLNTTAEYSEITLTLYYSGNTPEWRSRPLHFFLGRDREQAAQLALWLDFYLCDIQLRTQGKTIKLHNSYPVSALWGTERQVSILPAKENSPYSILQLVTEYYYLPHVHDFVTIDMQQNHPSVKLNADRTFELILRFEGNLELTDITQTFLLDCVPVRHLEPMTSAEIPVSKGSSDYEIPLDKTQQLFSLNHVYASTEPKLKRGQPYRYLPIEKFTPTAHFQPDAEFLFYYQLNTDCDILQHIRHQLHFFDCHGQPANNLLPQSIFCQFTGYHSQAVDLGIGDINQPGENATGLTASNITPVSACYPPMVDDESLWSLISCFAGSAWIMFKTNSLQELLKIFDFSSDHILSRRIQTHINGIVRLENIPIDRLDKGVPVRGHQLILTLNPDCYANQGEMYQFSLVVTRLLTFFISMGAFLMMKVIDSQTGEVLWDFQQMMFGLRAYM